MWSRVALWGCLCIAALAGFSGCKANPCGRTGERCCAAKDAKQQCKLASAGWGACLNNRCCMVSRSLVETALETTVQAALADRRGNIIGCLNDGQCCDKEAKCTTLKGKQYSMGFCCVASGKACTGESSCCNPEEQCVGTQASKTGVCQVPQTEERPRPPSTPSPSCKQAGASCNNSDACCSGLECRAGRCSEPVQAQTPPASTPPPSDASGLEIPDRLKNCADATTPLECTNLHRCGWCDGGSGGSGRCIEGGPGAGTTQCNAGVWRYVPADVGDDNCESFTDCQGCVRGSPCGWCAGGAGKCVRGTTAGPDKPMEGCEVTRPDSREFSECKPEEDEWMFTTYECDLNNGKVVKR